MGYSPPPTRRLSDKKRYYYSNNPNRRQSAPYNKKLFPNKSYSNVVYAQQSHLGEDKSGQIKPDQNSGSSGSHYNPARSIPNDMPRQSRYSVSSGSRTVPNWPRSNSTRFHQDADSTEIPSSNAQGYPTNRPGIRQVLDNPVNVRIDRSTSRYSQATAKALPTVPNIPTTPANASRYNQNKYSSPNTHHTSQQFNANSQYYADRHRPRSMDGSYPAAKSNGGSSTELKSMGKSMINATGYFNRSNNWRHGSYSGQQPSRFTENDISTPTIQSNYRSTPPLKANITGTSSKPRSDIPTDPNLSGRYSTKIETTKSNLLKHDVQQPTIPKEIPKSPKDELKLPSSVQNYTEVEADTGHYREELLQEPQGISNRGHSKVSSLINSVRQTTRQTEQQVLIDHKRIDVSKPEIQNNVRHNNNDSPVNGKSSPDIIKKNENKKIIIPRKPSLSTMWSSNTNIREIVSDEMNKGIFESSVSDTIIVDPRNRSTEVATPISEDNYEYISDPNKLRTNIAALPRDMDENLPIPEPLEPLSKCIFPMREVEFKLWKLKNNTRPDLIKGQKYLLKRPVKSVKEYSFFSDNILIYKQAVRITLLKSLSEIKLHVAEQYLQLKKRAFELNDKWEKECDKLQKTTDELRKKETEYRNKIDERNKNEEKKQVKVDEKDSGAGPGLSRRRNRADFVDDTEIENVLLQIDPTYKHHKAAATIPPLIRNPIKRFSLRFQNVNNLVTDKEKWTSRILQDNKDTFTSHEHELFLEGYLMYPKRFGRISNYMGGLRTPEECTVHYYRTKPIVDYKGLLLEKSKRRKILTSKRRKRKEKGSDAEQTSDSMANTAENTVPLMEQPISAEDISKVDESVPEKKSPVMEEVVVAYEDAKKLEVPTQGTQKAPETEAAPYTGIVSNDLNLGLLKAAEIDDHGEKTEDESENILKRDHDSMANIGNEDDDQAKASSEQTEDELHPKLNSSIPFSDRPDDRRKKRHKELSEHKTSYWSVKEAQAFPDLLKMYGSQWSLISEHLASKSTTMVRNYFQRNASHFGWKEIVADVDYKRNVGNNRLTNEPGETESQPDKHNIPVITNGIPSQQEPALGFFSRAQNQNSVERNHNTVASQTFARFTEDSLSHSSSSPLPPPRLPSIQLHNGTASGVGNYMRSETSASFLTGDLFSDRIHKTVHANSDVRTNFDDKRQNSPVASHLSPHISTLVAAANSDDTARAYAGGHANIEMSSILNSDDRGVDHHQNLRPSFPGTVHHHPDNLSNATAPRTAGAVATAHVVQNVGQQARSSSISALLNPVSNVRTQALPTMSSAQRLPTDTNTLSSSNRTPVVEGADVLIGATTLQKMAPHVERGTLPAILPALVPPQRKVPDFANDPLAALAAIASAPETLASMLPESKKE
ncbi:Snt1p KNAG_0C00870 [Huiozyma naganishii CBS 8797]|uniref:Uncharacterized protein n=1 Tax=Huiozyma naganishii (strain ATCC MYA-139 / BCRC 22969 / CBS 8797 / KCTC 17520 / NBRC 10181 / NCYC 3082 / Yp74L-3) TaxID=1071383 RepID=J7R2Z1_HUIN7|nr:hypothetical protein KNAG_0C00870 [Kazachstania naganishii CBS 8797]CCK69200.1 hypothetical protein KNAG_0C00870 [Kazachstania naganishii CBS 8797]